LRKKIKKFLKNTVEDSSLNPLSFCFICLQIYNLGKKSKKTKKEKKRKEKEKEVAPTIHLTPVKTNTVKLSLLFYCSNVKIKKTSNPVCSAVVAVCLAGWPAVCLSPPRPLKLIISGQVKGPGKLGTGSEGRVPVGGRVGWCGVKSKRNSVKQSDKR
jgi:hypothetical protein